MSYPILWRSDAEPEFDDLAEERAQRKRRLALAYRVFGAFGWGALGDGHISARDRNTPTRSGWCATAYRSAG